MIRLTAGVRRRERRADSGFSLIEVLISLGVLAIAMLGVLPMFTRSMTNNVEGSRISEVTSFSRTHLETLYALPFNAPDLTVPPGQTVLETRDLYSGVQDRWIDEGSFPADEPPWFSRTTRVRQFNVDSINNIDLVLDDAEALDGSAPTSQVHLKEIEVRVNTGPPNTSNLMGLQKAITLRMLKSL